ncbi:MAG: hypothetical protein K2N27_08115 [Ruminococcus sp.]|nr:hypothetical protein [Ruminococcus sp.]
MAGLIKNLEKIAPDEDIMEGDFKSLIFKGEDDNDELSIYLRNPSLVGYAEKCIRHFNSLSDDMIDEICHGLIESCHLSDDEEFELPELENVRDILEYCWFSSMTVDVPEDDEISYLIEGEGDWGEAVGFVIKNSTLAYVGDDYEEYL